VRSSHILLLFAPNLHAARLQSQVDVDIADPGRLTMSKAYFSESLARGLAVLRSFDRSVPRQRITVVAKRTGLTRAAARRFLLTLKDLGYVGADGDTFYLRPRVLDLGYHFFATNDVASLIQPVLAELADRTQEATTFGVLEGNDVLIIARSSKRLWDLHVSTGSRLPLLQTSLGLVLLSAEPGERQLAILNSLLQSKDDIRRTLSQLEETAKKDYYISRRELSPNLTAVAVPVRDSKQNVVGALNLTSHTSTLSHAALKQKVLPLLRDATSQIQAAIRTSEIPFNLRED
jgi:IclR family pca regulon transcriptional regulator